MTKSKLAQTNLPDHSIKLDDGYNSATQAPAPLVDKFVIRLPEGLRNQIKELSEMNHRSMNSEIVMVLEKHVQKNQMTEMLDKKGNVVMQNESSLAEIEVSERLEDLKKSLLQLMS